MDEQEAIALLKRENLAGLEFLVNRFQVKALHTAYLIIGDYPSAEDVVQTVFLRLIDKINQFDDQRSFFPWFIRIIVNDSIKEIKRRQRHISLDGSDQKIQNWLLNAGPRPEALADTNELRQEVWHALRHLTPEQRAVIVQRHFLEMSEAEMADDLQRPVSTIKWWLHTARKRLKILLSSNNHVTGEDHER